MVAGVPHVEPFRRVHPVLYRVEDRWTDTSALYIGMTPTFGAAFDEPVWQIERVTFDGTKLVSDYANVGKFNCKWDDRATYFGASGGVPLPGDVVTGSFSLSGLNIAGKISTVVLNTATWTALPPTPLANRNALTIQNQSGVEIKLNYDNTEPGYVGIIVGSGAERYYDIKDTIPLYAKASSGTPSIIIEEIS